MTKEEITPGERQSGELEEIPEKSRDRGTEFLEKEGGYHV